MMTWWHATCKTTSGWPHQILPKDVDAFAHRRLAWLREPGRSLEGSSSAFHHLKHATVIHQLTENPRGMSQTGKQPVTGSIWIIWYAWGVTTFLFDHPLYPLLLLVQISNSFRFPSLLLPPFLMVVSPPQAQPKFRVLPSLVEILYIRLALHGDFPRVVSHDRPDGHLLVTLVTKDIHTMHLAILTVTQEM